MQLASVLCVVLSQLHRSDLCHLQGTRILCPSQILHCWTILYNVNPVSTISTRLKYSPASDMTAGPFLTVSHPLQAPSPLHPIHPHNILCSSSPSPAAIGLIVSPKRSFFQSFSSGDHCLVCFPLMKSTAS